MTETETAIENIKNTIDEFLHSLNDTLKNPQKIEKLLQGRDELTSSDLILTENLGFRPEKWIEDALVSDLLSDVGLNELEGRPASIERGHGEEPDFVLQEDLGLIIGECKSPNNLQAAVDDLEEEYLRIDIFPDNGIATDGLDWKIIRRERGGDFANNQKVREPSLRNAITKRAHERGIITQSQVDEVDLDSEIEEFVETLRPEALVPLLEETAPKEYRDKRLGDVQDFYELYVQLIFGESEDSRLQYETCLINNIRSPEGASKKDVDIFAAELVNRLLFIKFLENNKVIPQNFLRHRVQEYDKFSLQSLYESRIQPLFYRVLNTPKEEREPSVRGEPYNKIPYLNGGLFRPTLSKEKEYDVEGDILEIIILDLVEGEAEGLNFELDPAILGSVFEKTINNLGAKENRQKDLGAYYTPNDVTQHITEQTVDKKIRDVIIDNFAEHVDQSETFRKEMNANSLREILSEVEGESAWFQSTAGYNSVQQGIKDIKILDPACGSGHFLTSAMERLYQARASVERGLKREQILPDEKKYEIKKQIALNNIYGVDVDTVAIEIAKLRVWLKIVEQNSWQPEFSKLPNIDVNVVSGNSLVGFPFKGKSQIGLDVSNEGLEKLERQRELYKSDKISKDELREAENEAKKTLDEQFLNFQKEFSDTKIEKSKTFDRLKTYLEQRDTSSVIKKVKVKRDDNEALSQSDKNFLAERGFSWQEWRSTNKSASLEIIERKKQLEQADNRNKQILKELHDIISRDFIFTEVLRKPIRYDLDQILGESFHWGAEFPEILADKNIKSSSNVNFDVILGNPPYGDILSPSSTLILNSYETNNINDVVSQFVERQIQLLGNEGYFGNIVNLRLVYDTNISEFHSMMREGLSQTKISCFERRPSQIFSNAQVQVGIIKGKNQQNDQENGLYTSRFIRFNRDDRGKKLDYQNIQFKKTKDYTLRGKIGGKGPDRYNVLPKIGDEETLEILSRLSEFDETVDDFVVSNGRTVFRQRGGGYRPIAMLDQIYESGSIEPIHLGSVNIRNITFLIINSSLFYLYWMVYGDAHHVNTGMIKRFPLPPAEEVSEYEQRINELTEEIDEGMRCAFDESQESFHMSEIKHKIHKIDDLLSEIYNISESNLQFIKNFHSKYIWNEK